MTTDDDTAGGGPVRGPGDRARKDLRPATGYPLARRVPGPLVRTRPGVPPGESLDHASTLVQRAIDDLAGRLGVERDTVAVVEARAVTWPDTSCGCPQPGIGYAHVRVDGAFVLLHAGGRRYDYRGGNPLVLCERSDR